MKIFDRYIITTIVGTFVVVALVMVGLYSFISFISELSDTGVGGYGAVQAAEYVLLGVPQGLYQIFPIVVLIGTLMGLGALASGSELIVLRTSGISVLRLTVSALQAGVILALVCFAVGNWVAPYGQQLGQDIRAQARTGKAGVFAGQSLWLRQAGNYIHIGRLLSANRILDVVIYRIEPNHSISQVITAVHGQYRDGAWDLKDVSVTRFPKQRVKVEKKASLIMPATIDPAMLRLFVVQPENLPLLGLYRYAQYMQANDIDASQYRLAFWRKLATPVAVLVMIMLAVPFVLGPLRSAGAGQRLFVGVLAGIGFFMLNEIVANTGQVFGVVPWLTAWAPTVVLGALALWRLRSTT